MSLRSLGTAELILAAGVTSSRIDALHAQAAQESLELQRILRELAERHGCAPSSLGMLLSSYGNTANQTENERCEVDRPTGDSG